MNILKNLCSNLKSLCGSEKNEEPEKLSGIFFINTPIASLITNTDGVIIDVNKSFSILTGYSSLEAIGKNMSILESGKHSHSFYRELWGKLSQVDYHTFEIHGRCKNNAVILLKEQIIRVKKDKEEYFIITLEDITIAKEISQHNRYLATHDPLTGLANRELLNDRFTHALLNAKRTGKKIALIVCDVNKFKTINDTLGHNFGDLVLKEVSKRLREFVRESDTVARHGGDEFMIVLEHLEDDDEALRLVMEIKSIFPMKIVGDDGSFDVTMSIGHANYPNEGTTFKELAHQADLQMYKNKKEYHAN